MANAVCFSCVNSITAPSKPSISTSVPKSIITLKNPKSTLPSPKSEAACALNYRFHSLKTKATDGGKGTKANSIVCEDCDGNGAILCKQCKGSGVNSVDYFNGQFKAGAICWLCRGKREILCGSCNGAGFLGGFMSTFDD